MKLLSGLGGTAKRRVIETGVLCLLASAGWMYFVRPREHALECKRAEFMLMRERVERARSDQDAGVLDQNQVRHAIRVHQELKDWIAPGRPAASLYDDVTGLVRDNGLQLASVNPIPGRQITFAGNTEQTQTRRATSGRRAAAAAKAATSQRGQSVDARAEVVGYRLAVSGRFESIMRFMQECEDLIPATRIAGFSISPARKDSAELEATIETMHLLYQPVQAQGRKTGKGGTT